MADFRIARRKDDYEGIWLITFADLMVQLMAFFAVIYSYSAQDSRKLQAMMLSIKKSLGVAPQAESTGILPGSTGLDPARVQDVEKLLSDLKAQDGPDVGTRMRIVSFRGAILFREGSATLDPAFLPLLDRVAQLVGEYPGFTLVLEGHAAPTEKAQGGGDALALSGLRAAGVLRALAARGVQARAMAAESHGDAQVEGDPSSPEGRALQRRVRFRFQRVAER